MIEELQDYLDAEELAGLAQYEVARERPGQALVYLKLAVEKEPGNARVKFRIGSLHADLGLIDRGLGEIHAALELQPDFHAARFRLGDLHIRLDQVDEARTVWEPLTDLNDDNALQAYVKGMLLLAEGDVQGYTVFEAALEDGSGDRELLDSMYEMLEQFQASIRERPDAIHLQASGQQRWTSGTALAMGALSGDAFLSLASSSVRSRGRENGSP